MWLQAETIANVLWEGPLETTTDEALEKAEREWVQPRIPW